MVKSREQFEAWFRRFGSEDECTNMLQLNSYKTNYLHPHADLAWIAWQASRAAIEIELPQPISEFNKVNGHVLPEAAAYDEALADCAEVIRESGLRVAGSDPLQTVNRLLDDALNHLKMDNPAFSLVAGARNRILSLIGGVDGVSDE